MSKRAYISRYALILKKLRQKPYSSKEEIRGYVEREMQFLLMQDDELYIADSIRTLERDLRELRTVFGISIEYSKLHRGYYLEQSEMETANFQRMVESFDVFNSLNLTEDAAPFIHLEKRKSLGTENLYGLIHAIKNKWKIKFEYIKFEEEEKVTQRYVEPYGLKEFKNRWYLLAKDQDDLVKTFGLDRLSNLEITKNKCIIPKNYNIDDKFRHSFGIIDSSYLEPQEVILSFNHEQGKYIKTLPLHHSQKTLIDTKKELRISLFLCLTHDFEMELLSYAENVEVIQPKSLIKTLKKRFENALKKYNS